MPDTEDRFTRALRLAAFDAITEELLQKKYITESEAKAIRKKIVKMRQKLVLPDVTAELQREVTAHLAE